MFLEQVLPATGLYCAAVKMDVGFRHRFFDSITHAHEYALAVDAKGQEVYIAQATYSEAARAAVENNRGLRGGSKNPDWKKERVAVNAVALRSFFIDIDCGPDKPYPTQREGALALKELLATAELPTPAVVSSGGGLYAYWPMDEDIPVPVWRTVATLLKNVLLAYDFEFDPVRTADVAGVLRPPGSHNKKPHVGGREVAVLTPVPRYSLENFVVALEAAAKKKQVKTNLLAPAKATTEWDDYSVYQDIPADPDKIADRCGQIRHMRDTLGDISEPSWYASIGVLRYAVDGAARIQEWSSGHVGYSPEATDRKIEQHIAAGIPPTTCAHFGSLDAKPCVGCKYKDKIKSPIVLGRPDAITAPAPEPEICTPNPPYIRAADGLYIQEGDLQFKFYDLDLYPVRVAYDESLGYEVVTFRHTLPHDGAHEFTLRSALVNDPKALLTVLWDNHVSVAGKKEKACMVGYIESYTQKLQRQRKMSRLLCQMGWKDLRGAPAFILGKTIYYADGTTEKASLAHNIPAVAEAYEAKGDLQAWVDATAPLDAPGAEPFAFALLAGGFGAPLMKFTGYDGAVVCLVGRSGIGKTLVSRMVQSVYGDERRLMMLKDDTRNSLMTRLGVYGSLPLTVDEVTNMSPEDLSELVYRITQGRDKARLNKNAVEKAVLNQWNTIALVSSNASLVEKLTGHKFDSSAEVNRVFEYHVRENPHLDRKTCTTMFRTIQENYGLAGEAYIQYLASHTNEHQEKMDQLAAIIEERAEIGSDDRFWGAILSAAIYGGMIASHLGLIKFNVNRVLKWGITQLIRMKAARNNQIVDAIGALGMFLDAHVGSRLIVNVGHNPRLVAAVIDEPSSKGLVYRIETDTRRVFISRAVWKNWLSKSQGNYSAYMEELMQKGILTDPNKRKMLGAGTSYAGAAQPCWEINLDADALGDLGVIIKNEAELLARVQAPEETDGRRKGKH